MRDSRELALQWDDLLIPFPEGSGISAEKEAERSKDSEVSDDSKETQQSCIYFLIQQG